MGSGAEKSFFATAARLKREDYKRTKHDAYFSKWQVLIGPSDWEDYSLGKEGAPRYRVHNLPTSSCPGLYELGIAVSRSGSGRGAGKLDPDDIVVVYLGQADNVRTRLQGYGRSGSHLGNSYSSGHWNESYKADSPKQAAGLFEEIFSKGYSIVFRWASVKDKKDAEEMEARLLDTFDYAWNKGGNGTRRPNDICKKLDKISSSIPRIPNIAKKLHSFSRGKVGIKIEASKPPSPQRCNSPPDEDDKSFFSGIFKFSRSQPRLVSDESGIIQELVHTCGFVMEDGILCKRPPVPGRKRCEEHKGKRIHGFNSKSNYKHGVYPDSHNQNDTDHKTACGVNSGNGTFCKNQPVPGRKRCEEHKGMRVNNSISKPPADIKLQIPSLSSVFGASSDWNTATATCKTETDNKLQFQSSDRGSVNERASAICGATLMNGSFCRRQPSQGNKRCWQHKGLRCDGALSGINFPSSRSNAATCGVNLMNGSVCMRPPVHGRKRCEQHKGMRV